VSVLVLVVDDVEVNRQHFQELLNHLGVRVLLADSAESGLKVLEQHLVDAVFLDYNMPGMNGFDFIEEARLIPGRAEIPIVMMSTDMMINELAVSRGLAQAWLTKRATSKMVENVLQSLGIW
jgi:CheY-like chemotaxis protein